MRKLFYVPIAIGIFIGCAKPSAIEPIPEMNIAEYSTKADDISIDLAKRLAINISNPEFKNFIKNEVNTQFDGDYNFLVLKAINKPIGDVNSTSFINLLYNNVNNNARVSNDDLIEQIEREYPLLQIAIPELAALTPENWDTETHTPLIAVVPRNYKEEDGVNHILAFDAEGNEHYVDTKNEPNELVIIISANERIQGFEKEATNGRLNPIDPCLQMNATPVLETTSKVYYLKDDVSRFPPDDDCDPGDGDPGDGNPPPPSGCTLECDRDCKTGYNYIEKGKFASLQALRDYEDFIFGAPELRFLMLKGAVLTTAFTILSKTYSNSKRGSWKSCGWLPGSCEIQWHTMNLQMLKWPEVEMGDRMRVEWWEEYEFAGGGYSSWLAEGVQFRDRGLTFGDANYSSPTSVNGKSMGQTVIYYCDNTEGIGQYYTAGDFEFYVNQ